MFPAWDRAGAHLHCFQTLCSLPLGSFFPSQAIKSLFKKLSSDPEKKHFLLWKSPQWYKEGSGEQGPVKITSVLPWCHRVSGGKAAVPAVLG